MLLNELSFEWSQLRISSTNSKLEPHLVQHNEQHHWKELTNSFHLNGHTSEFRPQAQKFACFCLFSFACEVKSSRMPAKIAVYCIFLAGYSAGLLFGRVDVSPKNSQFQNFMHINRVSTEVVSTSSDSGEIHSRAKIASREEERKFSELLSRCVSSKFRTHACISLAPPSPSLKV